MNDVLVVRHRNGKLYAGLTLAGLLIDLLALCLALCSAAMGRVTEKDLVAFSLLLVIFTSGVALFSCHLLYSWRHQIEVNPERITSQGIVRRKTMRWKDVESAVCRATWITWEGSRGVLILKTHTGKIRLRLNAYEHDDARLLVDAISKALPTAIRLDRAPGSFDKSAADELANQRAAST